MKRVALLLFTFFFILFILMGCVYGEQIADHADRLVSFLFKEMGLFVDSPSFQLDDKLTETLVTREGLEPPSDIESLALLLTKDVDNEYEKVVAVYDWVTANFAYDLEKFKNISDYDHGALYLLRTGKGICYDYADLVKVLLQALDLEVTSESGEVFPSPGQSELHAWNHVRVDGVWHAMDTTWGSGFIISEEDSFIQKPRRLYLTTPEELYRLHREPAYKDEQEKQYLRKMAEGADLEVLTVYEDYLYRGLNSYRFEKGLPFLDVEGELHELLYQEGEAIALDIIAEREYSLSALEEQIRQRERAGTLNFKTAGMYVFIGWDYFSLTPQKILEEIIREQSNYLDDSCFDSVTVGVVRKGDLIVVIHVYFKLK